MQKRAAFIQFLKDKKAEETTLRAVAIFILVALVVGVLAYNFISKTNKAGTIDKNMLEQLKNSKIDLGDLTQEQTNKMKETPEGRELYLDKVMEKINKGIEDGKKLISLEKYSDALVKLESELNFIDGILNEIDNEHRKLGDQRYILRKIIFDDKKQEIAQLVNSVKSASSLKNIQEQVELGATVETIKTYINANSGKIEGSIWRKELFFATYTNPTIGDYDKFKQEQLQSAQDNKAKAEVEYALGLILEDEKFSSVLGPTQKKNASDQFSKVINEYTGSYPFVPMAQYKVAKLQDTPEKQFAAFKASWEKYKSDWDALPNSLTSINDEIFLEYVKKGYSEYTILMELHGVLEDDDFDDSQCEEFSTSTNPSVFYEINKGKSQNELEYWGIDQVDKISLDCKQNSSKDIYFPINKKAYKFSKGIGFYCDACEIGKGIPVDDQVENVVESCSAWMEFRVIDTLTGNQVCMTKRPNNPQTLPSWNDIFAKIKMPTGDTSAGNINEDLCEGIVEGILVEKDFTDNKDVIDTAKMHIKLSQNFCNHNQNGNQA